MLAMWRKIPTALPRSTYWPIVTWKSYSDGTAMHTINVKKRIESTRDKAMQGGGQRRIDNQHKKVSGEIKVTGFCSTC